ncbi:MAG: hypothetical protein KAU95_03835, partial [Candidatus Aenigmarchaeota archaeon]|nr:hypothetical protein [Candidatus Aenigmarchaeota archaeon]
NAGDFDCGIGELNKNFVEPNKIKMNAFICNITDSNNLSGNGMHEVKIGLNITNHLWNDTTLNRSESASLSVAFKNIGDLTFAKEHLYWEVSSEPSENPENIWIDACLTPGNCYKQFTVDLAPGTSVTYNSAWSSDNYKYGKYIFRAWVRFPNLNNPNYPVYGQFPVAIFIQAKPPTNLSIVSVSPTLIDRDKETINTEDAVNIKIRAKCDDNLDGENLTVSVWVKSNQNAKYLACSDQQMPKSMSDDYYGTCIWNPPNNMSDDDLGLFDIKFKVTSPGGRYKISDYNKNEDKFKVEDIIFPTIYWAGNTTNLHIGGVANYGSNNTGINFIINQNCHDPAIPLYEDGNPNSLRLCGINPFIPDLTCSINNGNFLCYIKDLKLTNKITNLSFILTDNKNLSGCANLIINLDGMINHVELNQRKLFLNIFEPINYTSNISNYGNIGWHGEIYNQTRNSICSFRDGNPNQEHCSVRYSDKNSFINLQNGKTRKFNYIGYSSYILGTYKNHSMN